MVSEAVKTNPDFFMPMIQINQEPKAQKHRFFFKIKENEDT